jgi:hypothetical protein
MSLELLNGLNAAAGRATHRLKQGLAERRLGRARRQRQEQGQRYQSARTVMAGAQELAYAATVALEARWQEPTPWSYDRAMIDRLKIAVPASLAAQGPDLTLFDVRARRDLAALLDGVRAHNRQFDEAPWSIIEYSAAVERLAQIECDATDLAHAAGMLLRAHDLSDALAG